MYETASWREQHGSDSGERTADSEVADEVVLFEDVGDPNLEPVKVIAWPAVTHVKYRIVR